MLHYFEVFTTQREYKMNIRISVPRSHVHSEYRKFDFFFLIAHKLFLYLFRLLCQLKVVLILYPLLRHIPEKFYPKLLYPIEYEIISSSTRVIFTRSKHNNQQICLKLWQLQNQNICNEKLVTRNIHYLLEGFEFNHRFAPDVYLGVAPVILNNNNNSILRGQLIEKPEKSKLHLNAEYALMMRRLEEEHRLDSHLKHNRWNIATRAGMEFLASEVAAMHTQLNNSPDDMRKSYRISSKLNINIELFHEALNHSPKRDQYVEKYQYIADTILQACKNYAHYFEERCIGNHIKRCHGDLKTTNLWIYPKKSYCWGLMQSTPKLVALDCVDFNPDFCHIDTLSDVAMLAIDLEMHLSGNLDGSINTSCEQEFSEYFLNTYLQLIQENSKSARPLLEYYMTEKAMVCAYVSILYDKLPDDGEKYLNIAFNHAQRLKNMQEQLVPLYQNSEFLFSSTSA